MSEQREEAPAYRRCRRRHLLTEDNQAAGGRCRRCKRNNDNRTTALRRGYPICANGHGLMPALLNSAGECVECAPPAPADDWLDWVAVDQAIRGRRPFRPLTKYETLCAIATVARRGEWTRAAAADWLRTNTWLTIPEDDGQYLELDWAPRLGLPVLTTSEAIGRDLRPDLLVADHAGELDEEGRPKHDSVVFGEGAEDGDYGRAA